MIRALLKLPLLPGLLCAALLGCSGDAPGLDAAADSAPADAGPAVDLGRDASGDQGGLLITGLRVDPNPGNRLSCIVSWRTSQPALSHVDFREDSLTTYRVAAPAPTTSHRLLVFGLHAESRYQLLAVSRAASGQQVSAAAPAFTTGKLPAHVPRAELVLHDRRLAQDGWTLMTVSAGERHAGTVNMDPSFVPTAVIYDMQGRPVWYHEHGLPRVGDTRYVDGHVLAQSMGSIDEPKLAALEVDLWGRVVWRGPRQPQGTTQGHYNHHFEKLASGNYLTMKNEQMRKVLGDVLVELTPSLRVVWSWRTLDYLEPKMALWSGKGMFDYTHGNSAQMDAQRGAVFYNSRHLSMVFKIDKQSGKLLWGLGKGGDFSKDTTVKYPWFQQAHGVEIQPNGNVLLYDNGTTSRPFSRAVEYQLDEQKMTARVAWQYSGYPKNSWQTLYWGDADRLPNGNTLITAGTWVRGVKSRIFEVTADRRPVWEIRLPLAAGSGLTVGAYNSQRLQPPLAIIHHQPARADGGVDR